MSLDSLASPDTVPESAPNGGGVMESKSAAVLESASDWRYTATMSQFCSLLTVEQSIPRRATNCQRAQRLSASRVPGPRLGE